MTLRPICIIVLAALSAMAGCGGPLPPPDPPNLAEAKESLSRGNYWYGRGCYHEAERFYQEGLNAARLSDEVLLIIRAQNSLGAAALAQGEKAAAASYLEQAFNLTSGHPDRPELDKVLGNLGSLAFQAGRNQDAEEFWRQAAQTAEERNVSAAPYYCDLARLYLATGRAADFSTMAARALAAAEVPGQEPAVLADALNLAGQEAQSAGDAALAEARFRRALELDRQIENTTGLAQDTEALGLLLIRLERYSEAAGLLDRAFFLWLASGHDRNADRVLAALQNLSRDHKYPQKIDPYLTARRHPESYRLTNQCP